MSELPKVFANKIDKEIKNVQDFYYGESRSVVNNDHINIPRKINNIFSSSNHVYKSNVKITLKSGVVDKVIVGKTSNSLITMSGELINIKDIIDIVKI